MKYDGTNLKVVLGHHQQWCMSALDPNDKADFTDADLTYVDLKNLDLHNVSFKNANLYGTDLRWSLLQGADFEGACLYHTALEHADLSGAKNLPYIPMVCPEEGQFVAWKKCFTRNEHGTQYCIVKLLIPKDAKRSSGTTRKCRASKAKVLEFQTLEGHMLAGNIKVVSLFNTAFQYRVGHIVEPEYAFDEDRWISCGSGIHFFLNRQEAVEYYP